MGLKEEEDREFYEQYGFERVMRINGDTHIEIREYNAADYHTPRSLKKLDEPGTPFWDAGRIILPLLALDSEALSNAIDSVGDFDEHDDKVRAAGDGMMKACSGQSVAEHVKYREEFVNWGYGGCILEYEWYFRGQRFDEFQAQFDEINDQGILISWAEDPMCGWASLVNWAFRKGGMRMPKRKRVWPPKSKKIQVKEDVVVKRLCRILAKKNLILRKSRGEKDRSLLGRYFIEIDRGDRLVVWPVNLADLIERFCPLNDNEEMLPSWR